MVLILGRLEGGVRKGGMSTDLGFRVQGSLMGQLYEGLVIMPAEG